MLANIGKPKSIKISIGIRRINRFKIAMLCYSFIPDLADPLQSSQMDQSE